MLQHLAAPGSTWQHLAAPGSTWQCLLQHLSRGVASLPGGCHQVLLQGVGGVDQHLACRAQQEAGGKQTSGGWYVLQEGPQCRLSLAELAMSGGQRGGARWVEGWCPGGGVQPDPRAEPACLLCLLLCLLCLLLCQLWSVCCCHCPPRPCFPASSSMRQRQRLRQRRRRQALSCHAVPQAPGQIDDLGVVRHAGGGKDDHVSPRHCAAGSAVQQWQG